MYNYQILTRLSKCEIYEALVDMSLSSPDWYEYEKTSEGIQWLFEEMSEETKRYFFPEEKEEKEDVQLSENHE